MVEPVNLWLVAVVFLVTIVVMQASRIRRLKRDHHALARAVKREADETGAVWLCDLAREHGYPSVWDTPGEGSLERWHP
jgi:hypothetical protein